MAPGGSNGLQSQTGWPGRAIVAAILALVLLRVVVAASAGLTDDEAYYRLWSLAPAMGYLDHAPMVGVDDRRRTLARRRQSRSACASAQSSPRSSALSFSGARPGLLFGPAIARRAVWIALAMPLLAVGGVIVTPDTPSVLFWGLAAWALAELHVSRNANWWLAVGVFAGLGLLSKYTNLFAGAGILLWLLLIPANWAWFRAWQLWAGGAIAAVVALPVVLWNAEHGWVSFAKQFGRVGAGQQLTAVYFGELVGAYFGLASPIIAALALLGLVRVVRSAARGKDQSNVMLAASILPLLAYFLVHALHDRVQPNWLAPLYPSFAICAAVALAHIEGPRSNGATFGWLGKSAVALGFVMSAVLYLHAVAPLIAVCQGPERPDARMARAGAGGRPHSGGEGRLLGGDLELRNHRPARLRACRQGPRRAAHRTHPLSQSAARRPGALQVPGALCRARASRLAVPAAGTFPQRDLRHKCCAQQPRNGFGHLSCVSALPTPSPTRFSRPSLRNRRRPIARSAAGCSSFPRRDFCYETVTQPP